MGACASHFVNDRKDLLLSSESLLFKKFITFLFN
jgi:hypothetical protein